MVPRGWPLTLNGSGLVLRLGEVEASSLRLGECYLCIRSAAAAVATAKTPSATATSADAENVEENTVEVSLVLNMRARLSFCDMRYIHKVEEVWRRRKIVCK